MWVQIYKIGAQMWNQFNHKDKTGINLSKVFFFLHQKVL